MLFRNDPRAFLRYSSAAVAGVEIVLVATLMFQLYRGVWIIAGPLDALESPTVEIAVPERDHIDHAVLSAFDPFWREANATVVEAVEAVADIGLVLHGLRKNGESAGAAIIGAERSPQASYIVGDEIIPGIVLHSISSDHVILERGRDLMRLSLADHRASSSPGARFVPRAMSRALEQREPEPVALPEPAEIDGTKFLSDAGLRPRVRNGQVLGYTVTPPGSVDALREAGLVAGDVLVAVNGNRITPEIYEELDQEFGAGRDIMLTVEKDSATRMITVRTAGEAAQ